MYSPLQNFLKNPNKGVDFNKDLNTSLIKSELMVLILRFGKGPEENSLSFHLDNSIFDGKNPSSIAKKLLDAIEVCNSPIKSINRVTDLDTQLSKEIDLFTSGGGRGEYLQAAYSYVIKKKLRNPGIFGFRIIPKRPGIFKNQSRLASLCMLRKL